jgi:hypothetical protein
MTTIQILDIKFSTYIFTPSSSTFSCYSSSSSGVYSRTNSRGHVIISHWIVRWPAIQKHWMIRSNIPFPLVPIKNVLHAYFCVHIYTIQNIPYWITPPSMFRIPRLPDMIKILPFLLFLVMGYTCFSMLPNLHKNKLPLAT